LSGHITSIHEEKKPFNCDICDLMFSRKPNLNAHIARVHAGVKMDLSFKNVAKDPGVSKTNRSLGISEFLRKH
jgi:hypothetical protein